MPSREGGILTETGSNKLLSSPGGGGMFMKPQPSSASKMKAGSSSSAALKQEGAMKEEGDKVVVAVRIRPLTSVEQQQSKPSCVKVRGDGELDLFDDGNTARAFRFDHCFDSTTGGATQEVVFSRLGKDLLSHAWTGYNSSVFAYGQTGSGKTYTMLGRDATATGGDEADLDHREGEGLVPRVGRALLSSIEAAKEKRRTNEFCHAMQQQHDALEDAADGEEDDDEEEAEGGVKYSVRATYVEIYNEKVYDLMASPLATASAPAVLRVRESPKTGPFVEGAISKELSSCEQLMGFLEQGQRARRTAVTNMNLESSRSHAVLTLEFRQSTSNRSYLRAGATGGGGLAPDAAVDRVSRLCLVDLAGSERADKTGAAGVRLKESCRINQSLSVLGQVINALAEQAERNAAANKENGRGGSSYIPYRDSTLTWLLSDSLGGNAKTVMMATISPSPLQFEETLSTLRYASNAKKIVTHARINEDPKDRCIQDLLATIEDYKHRLALAEMACGGQQPSRPIAQPEEEEEEARRAALEREVSTLKIQNFARAKLLSKVKQQLAVAAATHESAEEEEAEVASLTTQRRGAVAGGAAAATELPYLIRLGEEAPTGQEQAFYLASEQTHFDRDGCIINASGDEEEGEESRVAFSIDFQDGRLFASVPPGRRLWVNGSEIFFTKRSDAVCLEVWNGTRLALDPTRVFLLLFDAPTTPTEVKPDTAHRQSQHLAAWEALRPHPPCYWRIAQMEVRRGCQLTAQEVKGLCRTWANNHTNNHEAASDEAGSSGLQSPALGLLASPSSSSSAAHQHQHDGPAMLDAHGHQLPPPPPAACSSRHHAPPRRASPNGEMMVSRLPRLAKQHRPLASAVPSLPSPVSSLQVLGVSSPTSGSSANNNNNAPATVTLMPPPPPPRSTGNALLQQPPAVMADRQQTPPQHDMPQQLVVVEAGARSSSSSSGLFDPTSNVQVLRGRANDARQCLERAERRLVALSVQQQQQRLSSLKAHALSLVPLVLEATALSLATNRRVSYFLDITPTSCTMADAGGTEEAQARLMTSLAGVEERDLCDYLGLIRDDAPPPRRVLLPRLLELASQELAVSVRVQDDVTGASTHVSAEHFSTELLPRLRQSRAHMLGTGGVVGEAGCEPLDHVVSEDLVLGSAHVYLSRLMDGRNIIGVFPLLSHDTGACLGAVSVRLLPEELPEDGRSGYSVALEIDHVSLDRAELGLLVPPATAGEEQQEPRLLLRYVLFSEALSGTVELSARSSSARKLLTQRTPEQPGDHVSYPVSHRRELCLSVLDGPFLAYLATGALVVSLHVERPQARSADDGQGMARAALAGGQHHRMAAAATQPGLRAEPTDRFQALHDVCLQQKVGQAASLSDDAASLFSGGDPRQSQQQQRRPGELELQSVAHQGGYGGGLETQSRCMSTRVSGPLLARHSHFYSLHCRPGPGCSTSFMYMMVDVLEPVLELGVDYFNECPRHFAPVDVKRPRRHVNKSCLSSSSSSSLAPSTFLQGNHHHSRDLDDDLSIDRASEMWSELDTAGGGGLGGPLQEPVFHVVANPLIRVRRLRIVLEQVDEPLAPFRLESCVRVLASVFVCINERSVSDGSDLAAHLAPQHELEVVSVRASPCKRRLEVTVELPSSQALSEHSSKGERVLLAVQPLVFVEGVVQPVAFHRVVVLKVLPVRRQTSMLYSMRKSLRDPTLDRMHQVGSYVAVKAEPANLLDDAVLDFVRFRLASHQRLVERSQLSRLYQEGSDEVKARPDLTVDSWKEVLNSPKAASAADRPLAPPPPAAALPSRRTLAAPAYLDQVELQGSLDDPVARPGALKQQTVTALFGVTPETRRRASLRLCGDGVYRVVDGAAAAGGDEAAQQQQGEAPIVSYAYPKGPMCPQRDWALLSHVRTEEVPDYPAQRAGFLSMRTGLLGTSWARAWFVWTRPFLFYYKGKTDRKMAGVINVTDCTITRGTDDYEMVLRGPHRKWQLQAANDDDFVQWATALGAAGPLLGLESGGGGNMMMMMTAPAGMLTASQSVWSDN